MDYINELPSYIYCPNKECSYKHYLSLNRDIHGKWVIGYVEYFNHTSIEGLALNDSDSIEEAAKRMKYALDRYSKKQNV